ncbi:MAG: hypothetical protein LAT57_10370, partial [Balneolales bacterium]|nr:hypothetical protein [Balneolales bacterium]
MKEKSVNINPENSAPYRSRAFLWLALSVVVTRIILAVLIYPDTAKLYNGDSALYEHYALSMLETGHYLAPGYGSASVNPHADMIRPPGLPLVLASVYGIFGADAGPWIMIAVNTLGILALLWLMLTFLRLLQLHRFWPLLFIVVLDPAWMLYSKEILTEPFFTPLLLFSVMLALVGTAKLTSWEYVFGSEVGTSDQPPWISRFHPLMYFALSGAALGLATWFKPITLYAPWAAVILLLLVGFLYRRRAMNATVTSGSEENHLVDLSDDSVVEETGDVQNQDIHDESVSPNLAESASEKVYLPRFSSILLAVVVFLVASQAFIFGWQMRNYVQHQTFAYTSIAAENMMTGHAAFVLAASERITHLEAQSRIQEMYANRWPDRATMSFSDQNEAKLSIAREIIGENRALYAKSILRGMAITLMDPGRLVYARTFRDADLAEIGLTNIVASEGVFGA